MTHISTLPPLILIILVSVPLSLSYTDPTDLSILQEFYKNLENPEKLSWPVTGQWDPCGQKWSHVFCSEDGHVTQIQAQNVGLKGILPKDFNKLAMLTQLGLQGNNFRGKLPSFSGLGNLQKAYLGRNSFDEIPSDFFDGLTNLQVISLDDNQLNISGGWALSQSSLASSSQLTILSLVNTSLTGQLPSFLGQLPSLSSLRLSYNNLTGILPLTLAGSDISVLWLNNQIGPGLSGPIDVITNMSLLQQVWIHGNGFQGKIPDSISRLFSLREIWLNNNELVGTVPSGLSKLPSLSLVKLDNNYLMGPVPVLANNVNFTYGNNLFCESEPGQFCANEVNYLLDFLDGVNYPVRIITSWKGNNPCENWIGVSCAASNNVSVINLPNFGLSGAISESLGNLEDLSEIILSGNNLSGNIPVGLTNLKNLKLLDVSRNNLSPPVPVFRTGVKLVTGGNPLLDGSSSSSPDSQPVQETGTIINGNNNNNDKNNSTINSTKKRSHLLIILLPILFFLLLIISFSIFLFYRYKKSPTHIFTPNSPQKPTQKTPNSKGKTVIPASNNSATSAASNSTPTINSPSPSRGNFVIPLQVLQSATQNFSPQNIIGRGGFGVVYKGELHDGTIIAVKRVESKIILSRTIPDEFQAEISTLTKIRHRNLVSIIGFSTECNEKVLVYEYMPGGSLSKRLFHYKESELQPLDWKQRLIVALDVARGMEYLHSLGGHVFIHRDLKSANILLGEDLRAKVADFGLMKLAPDGGLSVATRLAGTFGYLAPEYAITGKITTKVDVFSFGVVLMELITGRPALDESLPEETRYLPTHFQQLKNSKSLLWSAVDRSMADQDESAMDSVHTVAELAGHCVARDPQQRPDMGHAVNVLGPLVDRWRPVIGGKEECEGIDFSKPLIQLVKNWKEKDLGEGSGTGGDTGLEDSKGSIPARPVGFADSFTSADAR